MYLAYDEYMQMGGNTNTVDKTAFENLEFEARSYIDYWTFNRLIDNDEDTSPEAVKRCMFKLISLLLAKQLALAVGTPEEDGTITRGNIMSESNDGVSVSYGVLSANEVVKSTEDDIETTIRQYLGAVRNSLGQKVLYRGIYPNE